MSASRFREEDDEMTSTMVDLNLDIKKRQSQTMDLERILIRHTKARSRIMLKRKT